MTGQRGFYFVPAIMFLFILAGCVSKMPMEAAVPEQQLELVQTPFFGQKENQCGPASLAMLLGSSGIAVHPDELTDRIYLPERQGSLQVELIAATRNYGRIPYVIAPELSALIAELRAGRPVLVLQNLGLESIPAYHYAVVIGVSSQGKIVLRSGLQRRLEMSMAQFLMSWKRTGSWGIVALKPGELPAQPDHDRFLRAVSDFEARGSARDAENSYLAALACWPGDEDVLFALGNNSLARKEYVQAESFFRKVLAVNPGHLAAANNLAETLVRRKYYRQAAGVIAQAVRQAEFSDSPLKKQILQTEQEITRLLESSAPAAP